MKSAHASMFAELLLLSLAAQTIVPPCGAQAAGVFFSTGAMTVPRSQHTATLLADGRVLLTGGTLGDFGGTVLKSTEIYDPSTGAFTPAADMREGRRMHSATLLADGRVLIAGGYAGAAPIASAELYDPTTNTFSSVGKMGTGRGGHDAILLSDGSVLVLGGFAGSWPQAAGAEIYDPASGTFTPTGRYGGNGACDFCAPSVRLADGRVLFIQQQPAQLFDPRTATFTTTGDLITAPSTAALLMDGTVLVTGGEDIGRSPLAAVYRPALGTFARTGNMTEPRVWHSLTPLPDGTALAAGGETDSCTVGMCYFAGSVARAELYDPTSGAFSPIKASMFAAREGHTATLLNDGRVLLAGGVGYGGIGVFYGGFSSAELFVPERPIAAPLVRSVLQNEDSPDVLQLLCTGLNSQSVVQPEVTIGGRLARVLSITWTDSTESVIRVALPNSVALDAPTPLQVRYLGRVSNMVTAVGTIQLWYRQPPD